MHVCLICSHIARQKHIHMCSSTSKHTVVAAHIFRILKFFAKYNFYILSKCFIHMAVYEHLIIFRHCSSNKVQRHLNLFSQYGMKVHSSHFDFCWLAQFLSVMPQIRKLTYNMSPNQTSRWISPKDVNWRVVFTGILQILG